MEFLLPSMDDRTLEDLLVDINAQDCLQPFNTSILEFIKDFSNFIINDLEFRTYPELIAMAYWMRTSHIRQIQHDFEQKRGERVWLAKGVVLHFAPANVDSIFIYSWFLSMMAGNKNIIRLPQKRSKQMDLLINMLNTIVNNDKYEMIKKSNIIVSYGHEKSITTLLSQNCQIRVIWGGDEAVNQIRAIPLTPLAYDLIFGDKFSHAVIDAEKILNIDAADLVHLTNNFYNDLFWFDQLACSSPKTVIWVGKNDVIKKASKRFWDSFDRVIEKKNPLTDPVVNIVRLNSAFSYAAAGLSDYFNSKYFTVPFRIHIKALSEQIRLKHCGAGLILELEKQHLDDLINELTERDQTLSVFGFEHEQLRKFALKLGGHGIDRIVPIGRALEFTVIWDGHDLLRNFVREISIM